MLQSPYPTPLTSFWRWHHIHTVFVAAPLEVSSKCYDMVKCACAKVRSTCMSSATSKQKHCLPRGDQNLFDMKVGNEHVLLLVVLQVYTYRIICRTRVSSMVERSEEGISIEYSVFLSTLYMSCVCNSPCSEQTKQRKIPTFPRGEYVHLYATHPGESFQTSLCHEACVISICPRGNAHKCNWGFCSRSVFSRPGQVACCCILAVAECCQM